MMEIALIKYFGFMFGSVLMLWILTIWLQSNKRKRKLIQEKEEEKNRKHTETTKNNIY